MKHAPATPLPWEETFEIPHGSAGGSWGVCVADGGDVLAQCIELQSDADYIAHAANAYPKLVEALRVIVNDEPMLGALRKRGYNPDALLRELGEL